MPTSASECRRSTDFPYPQEACSSTAQKPSKPKMSTKRRVKASEREKMRMRGLADALHQLPSLASPWELFTSFSEMDVSVEQVMDHKTTEEDISDSKARGRGFKGRSRGGRFGRGGRGGRGMMMKGYGPPGQGRGRGRDGVMNGFGPGRRGMGRMRPYPDLRGRRGGRGGPMGMGPPPPPPMHMRGPYPPMHRHCPPPPPPRGHPGFRGRPPHPRGRGMHPGPHRHFHPRGFHNGPASLPPPPYPGRGQRWPAPPGGRHF
ncbi:hypothetical protein AAFF_G00241740 [Aldrovandia affinis]|uniref:Uncharacterized protein n=1 Tax=Aldrovandia affinis TaxID=143900 RepID=A0AAD7WU55_9TELE|nr:hypothetical protein AAFF_G00241740 [Aldrovandia affinis]